MCVPSRRVSIRSIWRMLTESASRTSKMVLSTAATTKQYVKAEPMLLKQAHEPEIACYTRFTRWIGTATELSSPLAQRTTLSPAIQSAAPSWYELAFPCRLCQPMLSAIRPRRLTALATKIVSIRYLSILPTRTRLAAHLMTRRYEFGTPALVNTQ